MYNTELDLIKEAIPLLNAPDQVIIVEGRKDVLSLQNLGITSEIYCLNNGSKTLYDRMDELLKKEKNVIILTDFDRKGESLRLELYKGLHNELSRVGKKIINEPVDLLKKTQISHIEGIYTRYENLKEKFFY